MAFGYAPSHVPEVCSSFFANRALTVPFMRSRTRNLIVVLTVAVVVAAIGLAVFLRKRAAPEPARLLPDSEAVVYFNLKTARRLTSFGDKPVQPAEPEYQQFVRETGFQFERDLDEAAFAVHFVSRPAMQKNAPPLLEKRYSEVFVGKFDGQRLSKYLGSIARGVERYKDTSIYSIPVEDRTVRVAILGVDSVAASNLDDASIIHGIIDRSRAAAMPFGGPALVRKFYPKVPLASMVWAIVHIPAQSKDPRASRPMTLPGGFDALIPGDITMVASVRYLGSIHARADFITPTDSEAKQLVDQIEAFLTLFKAIESTEKPGGNDQDVKAVFDSLKVEQDGVTARMTAAVPSTFLKKLLEAPPAEVTGAPQEKAPEEQAPKKDGAAPVKPKKK